MFCRYAIDEEIELVHEQVSVIRGRLPTACVWVRIKEQLKTEACTGIWHI